MPVGGRERGDNVEHIVVQQSENSAWIYSRDTERVPTLCKAHAQLWNPPASWTSPCLPEAEKLLPMFTASSLT